jgi:NitT/TauT family transport system substrate-binding protein
VFYHHHAATQHSRSDDGKQPGVAMTRVSRRACMVGAAASILARRQACAQAPAARLGILQFGTVQWVADVVSRNKLDTNHGITLQTQTLANTDAGRVALMAKSADIVTSDWTFVASQRAAGTKLCFAPFSSATGGVMVQPSSPIRSLADLANRRLGVAGGPLDKSWLIVRAAAKAKAGLDIAEANTVVYGAPPLLNAKLQQNELDAVLTFWNFAARLEVEGSRQIASVSDCTRDLGFASPISLVGFVFHQEWAEQNRPVIDGFLSAMTEAEDVLTRSETEWRKVRPLMNAGDDALFESFRRRFIDGIAHPSAEAQEQAARKLFDVLLHTGGKRSTDGLDHLPPGIFWPTSNA